MSKTNLVIVESPAKAKTIEKYLGSTYTVKATVGHVIDLPPAKLGVDLDNDFEPQYEIIKGKKKVIDDIKKAAQKATHIFLAPDPDREGEAIAWHMSNILSRMKTKPLPQIHRVLFNEITKKAIIEAVSKPTQLNLHMFEAQQARRILDRLVGYKLSPLLWDKVRRGLSAGRVQSVAVRLVCEREKEISAFNSEEYWSVEAKLEGSKLPVLTAKLAKKNGKNIDIPNSEEAQKIKAELTKDQFVLSSIQKREQKRNPSPPFITSKLQQEGARKLGFTAKKTMMLAQKLYEGMEVDGELVGLITYMRTDSTRTAPTALEEVRAYISKQYGKIYLPDVPHVYKSKKDAQDAHEAIRPTSMDYSPERVKSFMQKDEFRLYELIWKRFVASQMKPAVIDRTTFDITISKYLFRANGSVIKFPGFMAVYEEGHDDEVKGRDNQDEIESNDEAGSSVLPDLKEGEKLKTQDILPIQHFTQPPPRFTEASLVKELEEKGIGRPSTYASIMSVIQDKKYVDKDASKRFQPTDLGTMVNDLLVDNFPEVLDVAFTARMESELDGVEEGTISWKQTLADFYEPFTKALETAKVEMKNVKRQEIPTDLVCEKCGAPMIIKFGRNGEFLACQAYPECKNSKEFRRTAEGKIEIQAPETTNEVCEKCASPMTIKSGRFGKFLACTAYPACKTTKAISLGINCPLCAKGLSTRTTKRGKMFYGCTGYPTCKFASWDKPLNEKCPDCEGLFLVEKTTKSRGTEIRCPEESCGYSRVGG